MNQFIIAPTVRMLMTRCFFGGVDCRVTECCREGQTSATDGSTPTGLKTWRAGGSYSLGGFDNVNLFNGHMNFSRRCCT